MYIETITLKAKARTRIMQQSKVVTHYIYRHMMSTNRRASVLAFNKYKSCSIQHLLRHKKLIQTNCCAVLNLSCHVRHVHGRFPISKDRPIEGLDIEDGADNIIEDETHQESGSYLLPESGHNVFIILPDLKKSKLTKPEYQLSEACALIDTLPQWKVVHKLICRLKTVGSKYLFGKGNFEKLTREIRERPSISAVFVSLDMITGLQLATLQESWKLPVYDRYTIVLQIFKIHAKTKEAKLQVALAEIPYLKSRLRGMHQGTLDQQRGGLSVVGGSGETYLELRKRLLEEREIHIKKVLAELKKKRSFVRASRVKRELPIVAVVGYTNAGKTSLIKALTKESAMLPKNQLFATLDVTAHAGQLPSHMTVLFIDTVGFISDIPIDLIASFSATLEDAVNADLIVHVRDISHPDTEAQKAKVIETLKSLNISEKLLDNVIEVGNKMDLLESHDMVSSHPGLICTSATVGTGLGILSIEIEDKMIESTGRVKKWFKIPMDRDHLSWLHKEATVVSTETCKDDETSLLVHAILTKAAYGKFRARFSK